MCTSPLSFRPMSTKAPKSTTLRTVPFSSIPVFKSSSLRMPLRKMADARHLKDLLAALEWAMRFAPVHDFPGRDLVQTGDMPQQRSARGIEIDADMVHARLHDAFKRLSQELRIHIVLVQAHADVLRI